MAGLLLTGWLSQTAVASTNVSFTITPSAVSNTYSGFITLQVSNLTAGDTVVVQKFLDLNGNGIIENNDWLVQQFQLTDGQAGMVIGGIVNSNVPGDTDGTANGQITAQLNFQNGDFMQNIVGQYLFELSSPGNHFTPITNLFNVTNTPYAQEFTGNVVSNGTSTVLSNAIILLFGPPKPGKSGPGSSPQTGTVVNNSGSYTIQLPPGTYMPVALKSNYLANLSTSPVLTLSNGQTLTTNLTMTNATASISGSLVDASNSSGLPGILLSTESTNDFFVVGFTQSNGNFTIGVASNLGSWPLKVSDTSLIVHGYLKLQNKTNVNAGQTNVTLAVPQATALFYGSVKDIFGNPMPGIDVESEDNNNVYDTDGYTDTNGHYFAVALGGLSNDTWQVQIESDNNSTNYLFTQPGFDQNGGTNLSVGQAVNIKFTALLATNSISGYLTNNSGNPIAGVGMWANATINSVGYNQNMDTDTNGHYSMNAANGTWTVGVNTCSNCSDGLPGNYFSPPNQTVVISNNNGTANFTALLATNTISGYLKDNNSNAIPGIMIWASATINSVDYFQNVDTATNGNYSLGVINGTWTVGVETGGGSDGLPLNYLQPGNQTVVISNNNGTANFTAIAATSNYITGNVNCNGTNIVDVVVSACATINGTNYAQYGSTGTNGNYSLDVVNASWSVSVDCSGGPGGNLDDIFGSGNYLCPNSVNVTNNGTANFSVQLCNGVTITTTNLPAGQVNIYYDQFGQASSCDPSFTWSIIAGSLPPGLNANPSTGEISGTPTTPGTFNFTVQVIDGNSNAATQPLSIYIAPASASLAAQILFAASGDGNIYEFTTNGTTNIFVSGLSGDNEGMAFDSAGNLFVTDAGNACIYKFTTNGGQSTFASGLNAPRGLAFDNAGYLYQADAGTGNIYKYAPDGASSTFASGLGWPMSLAFDTKSNLYEADWDSGNIYEFTPGGVRSTFASGLNNPWGLAFDNTGNLFETDFGSGEIFKCATNGVPGAFASGLYEPEGLAVDNADNLFEANQASGNIYRYTPGGVRSTFATVPGGASSLTFQPMITVLLPLQITTTNLPVATQNALYSTTLTASGGQPPYTWGLVPGSASLPSGLSLAANGVISGTPIGSGTSQFIVLVTDATNAWNYQLLSLTVNASTLPQVIVLTAPERLGTNQFQFGFNSASGVDYTIQYSTNLKTWTSLLEFSGSGGIETITDPNAGGSTQRFYRVLVVP